MKKKTQRTLEYIVNHHGNDCHLLRVFFILSLLRIVPPPPFFTLWLPKFHHTTTITWLFQVDEKWDWLLKIGTTSWSKKPQHLSLLLGELKQRDTKVPIIYETKVVIIQLAKVRSMIWAFSLVAGVWSEKFDTFSFKIKLP